MLATPVLRPPLHLLRLFVASSFTVSGCNITRARKFAVQKKQTLNFGLKLRLNTITFW